MGASAASSAVPEPRHTRFRFLVGYPRGLLTYAAAMLLAVAGNCVVFLQACETVLVNLTQAWLIVLALGFANVSLMYAYYVGNTLRLRKVGLRFPVACASFWVVLGAVAIWSQYYCATFRCVVVGPPPYACVTFSSSRGPLSGAIFAGVYFATGLVTAIGAYLTAEDALRRRLDRAMRRAPEELRHPYHFSAQRLAGFAARVAGRKRTGVLEEWYAHLATQESKWHGYKLASGFLSAALRFRVADAADAVWVPIDAVLKSRTLSNLLVCGVGATASIDVGQHEGRLGVILSAESLIGIGGLAYGLIRVGRWYRDVKPPEPKARRENGKMEE